MESQRNDQRRITRPTPIKKNPAGNVGVAEGKAPGTPSPKNRTLTPHSSAEGRARVHRAPSEHLTEPSGLNDGLLCVAADVLLAVVALLLAVCCVWQGLQLEKTGEAPSGTAGPVSQVTEKTPDTTPKTRQEDVGVASVHSGTQIMIPATITIPADPEQPMALVVMCHGFTGNRKGDGHFEPVSRLLAEQGIASIAMDFSGCGDSSEPYTAYTMENMDADIHAAISYMTQKYQIQNDRIGLLGHSMGGRVVSMALDEGIAAAALWSPANNDGLEGIEFLDHEQAGRQAILQQARQEGSVFLSGWNVEVSCQWLEEMANSSPWQKLQEYQGPILVAFSGGDPELLSQQTIDGTLGTLVERKQNFVSLYGQFFNATHNYTAQSDDAAEDMEIRSRLEQKTAQFFVENLR